VLWETLTGQRLFKADDVPSLVYAIINEEVQPPSSIVPDLPPGLDEIVMKGLERDAENRWSSAREMAAALERALAPAPAREIGEWVHSIAGDALDWRQELVHRIESETSSSIPPPLRRDSPSSPIEVTSGVVPTDSQVDPRERGLAITNEDRGSVADDERETLLATSSRAPDSSLLDDRERDHGRPRIGLVAMAIAGVVFVGGGVLFGMRWVQMSTDTIEPTVPSAAATPAESESAIIIGGSQRNPPPGAGGAAYGLPAAQATAGGAASGAVGVAPRFLTQPAASGGVRPRATASTAPAHDDCDNPFTVDARGIRHPKPQCFNKK
jgi:serine/threonine-protein kinase